MSILSNDPDDMGDDEQETETALYERNIEDPPSELIIDTDDDGVVGIEEWLPMETRPGDARKEAEETDDRSAEEAAEHVSRRDTY
ncbi:hypothetical protein AB0I28_21895 [Phytomonospora sp. NPDC050363]|uniref:hypothetical protein n=1 Tax=Phytomonospora sp. NPDC050363 TaxID=3155642 RepID=UPI0033FA8693